MKRATACWAIAGLLVSLCTLFVLRYGTTHGPAVLVDSGSVAEAADQVMACAASGDYEALENLLYGAPHLGEAPQKDDSAQGLIWKAYLDSIEYSFPDSCYAVDANMALDVCVTCLDISSVTDSLQEIAPGLMAKKAAQITDEKKSLRRSPQLPGGLSCRSDGGVCRPGSGKSEPNHGADIYASARSFGRHMAGTPH